MGWVRALGCPPQYDTRPLIEALRTIVGTLDDPTGGEHVADMRRASEIARSALLLANTGETQNGSDTPQAHSPQDDTLKGIDPNG